MTDAHAGTTPTPLVDAMTAAIREAKLRRMYPTRQTICKDPASAEAKRLTAKAERQRRRRAQKRAGG